MANKEPTGPLWVCTDCFVLLVNGDVSPYCENPDDLLKQLEGFEPTAGMLREEHADGCDSEECDCETIPFSWSFCEGCGSSLGGERHAVTGWIPKEAVSA